MSASQDEFAFIQGEQQERGDRKVMGLGRALTTPMQPAEVPAVDQDDRQVTSTFDTRPIGSYDFVESGWAAQGNLATLDGPYKGVVQPAGLAPNLMLITFPLPVGFVAVIRRVEVFINPPHNSPRVSISMGIALQRNGASIPNNDIQVYGIADHYEWDTHQIFGYWETPSLLLTMTDGSPHTAGVRVLGTLIPAKNASPIREVGSLPVAIRGGPKA
jgi:hypothetical protein